ncbi:MAG TPA: polyphosphate kinase 1 [Terriglobia bacterium]|nr:polyphosphate kinase 1 [Terriglobia bacterium]
MAAAAAPPSPPNLNDPELYINRELSLLEFQRRVLEEAQDPGNPLLERVKFLSIFSSNIDEFFMVRVAGLLKQAASGAAEAGIDGRSAGTQLQLIHAVVSELSAAAHRLWREVLRPELAAAGIHILEFTELDEEQRAGVNTYFLRNVFPVLTPLGVDESRPFPHISSRSLNLAVLMRARKGGERFARVKIPDTLPQLVEVKAAAHRKRSAAHGEPAGLVFTWLEQVIAANLHLLFPGMTIAEAHPFRVIRDADVAVQELESDDLLETVEEAIRQRRFMAAVRLQVSSSMPDKTVQLLTSNLELDAQQVYRMDDPIAFSRLAELAAVDRPDLKDRPFVPFTPPVFGADGQEDIFALIRREDILLHHPYDSFQPVVEFLRHAARDPHVLAIKMTLYRVGRNSPVVAALLDAVEDGKQVAVLVELKARFDEESNIEWARTLENAGVHVVYGVVGLKVHSKIALVVRQEGDAIRRYMHLGTGNYNPITARIYTDFGLFTCDEEIAEDATYFFNSLTGYAAKHKPKKLIVAPINLAHRLHELIRRETKLQEAGEPGRLIFKMNALEDPKMIQLLYRASQAGVQVDLLVRGFCCLRPGVAGVSENIRVTSVVGRFLEHSRIYYFRNGGAEEVYLGSADLMRRSLRHRVEIIFPIRDTRIAARLMQILKVSMADSAKARYLASDGLYHRDARLNEPDAMNSQEWLLSHQGTV